MLDLRFIQLKFMDELKINQKFRELLPALTEEEHRQLEESIIKNGCETPLMIWENQIIDGHNRYGICTKNNIPFRTVDRSTEFETEDEVLEWIYINQLGRRNLAPNQKTLFIGELYQLRKKQHGGDRGNQHTAKSENLPSGHFVHLADETQNPEPPTEETADELTIEYDEIYQKKKKDLSNKTAADIAKQFGVNEKTVRRAEEVAAAVKDAPELKKDFLAGKVSQKEIIEKANQSLSPELKAAIEKKAEIKNSAGARWLDATYKIYLQTTSIRDLGGVEKLTANWTTEQKTYWRDELRRLQTVFGEFADTMEKTI